MALLTNLVGYWKCDESSGNLIDETANNNDLTNVNTATFAAGKINNGTLLTAASSQYFKITNAAQTGLNLTGDCSFSMWVKITSQPGTNGYYRFIQKSHEAGDQRGYALVYGDTSGVKNLIFATNPAPNGAWNQFIINCTLPTGVWSHIVVTWTAATHTTRFYQDGNLIATSVGTDTSTTINDNTADFELGAYAPDAIWPSGGQCSDAMFDEVGVWSRILNINEVQSLWNRNFGLEYPLVAGDYPTGGAITTDGSYTVHTFIESGNFITYNGGVVSSLVVAGGGAGGYGFYGGGGGAGGYQYNASVNVNAQTYSVVVGVGGTPSVSYTSRGGNGGDSSFLTTTSTGGGGGASRNGGTQSNSVTSGANGGSGGGAGASDGADTGGTGSQGMDGGDSPGVGTDFAGGGGGNTSAGTDGNTTNSGGGGNGTSNSITGSAITYAGGGGAGGKTGAAAPAGGTGGGGAGGVNTGASPVAGTDNLGGGGGGGGGTVAGAAGGKGVVIIRYLTSDFLGGGSLPKTLNINQSIVRSNSY